MQKKRLLIILSLSILILLSFIAYKTKPIEGQNLRDRFRPPEVPKVEMNGWVMCNAWVPGAPEWFGDPNPNNPYWSHYFKVCLDCYPPDHLLDDYQCMHEVWLVDIIPPEYAGGPTPDWRGSGIKATCYRNAHKNCCKFDEGCYVDTNSFCKICPTNPPQNLYHIVLSEPLCFGPPPCRDYGYMQPWQPPLID